MKVLGDLINQRVWREIFRLVLSVLLSAIYEGRMEAHRFGSHNVLVVGRNQDALKRLQTEQTGCLAAWIAIGIGFVVPCKRAGQQTRHLR